jgi:hypothetical protein
MVALGPVLGHDVSSPSAVSGDGSIVGGISRVLNPDGTAESFAFIWTRDRGARDLRQVLVNDYGYDLSGWRRLTFVEDISPDGRFLVGGGTNSSGVYEGFLVQLPAAIPEPSSSALAGLGLAALAGSGWRRSRQPAVGNRREQPTAAQGPP